MVPDVERACSYALDRLARELAPEYAYHSLAHTLDVVREAERLASITGLAQDAVLLLRTAAHYHDLGFVRQRSAHEITSVRIARDVLPQFGYLPLQLDAIGAMIMATRLPQTPQTLAEQLLADADLAILGLPSFVERNTALRREVALAQGEAIPDDEWYRQQYTFLRQHRYFTDAARRLYGAQKARNLAYLRQLAQSYV